VRKVQRRDAEAITRVRNERPGDGRALNEGRRVALTREQRRRLLKCIGVVPEADKTRTLPHPLIEIAEKMFAQYEHYLKSEFDRSRPSQIVAQLRRASAACSGLQKTLGGLGTKSRNLVSAWLLDREYRPPSTAQEPEDTFPGSEGLFDFEPPNRGPLGFDALEEYLRRLSDACSELIAEFKTSCSRGAPSTTSRVRVVIRLLHKLFDSYYEKPKQRRRGATGQTYRQDFADFLNLAAECTGCPKLASRDISSYPPSRAWTSR